MVAPNTGFDLADSKWSDQWRETAGGPTILYPKSRCGFSALVQPDFGKTASLSYRVKDRSPPLG